MKIDPQNLKSQILNPIEFPAIKVLDKSVEGFVSYDRTNKQTNRDYMYRFICMNCLFS